MAEEKKLDGCDVCHIRGLSDSPEGAQKPIFSSYHFGSRERAKGFPGKGIYDIDV